MKNAMACEAGQCMSHDGGFSRRSLLRAGGWGAAALALHQLGAAPGAVAARRVRGAIDVHHHFFPPVFAEKWAASPTWSKGATDPILPLTQQWSPGRMIEMLDEAGVQTAVISNNDRPFTASLPVEERRALATAVNEHGARMAADHRGRLGLFAYLPMPDVDGALRAIAHAFDVLKADGVQLMTSYGSKWVGDPDFAPIIEELNARKATVFCHPRAPACCVDLMPSLSSNLSPILEYPFDTGRAVLSLLVSGALTRYRDINWVFCHTGSVIPALASRFEFSSRQVIGEMLPRIAPEGVETELRRLNWDTAYHTAAPAMKGLLEFTSVEKVLFGSDAPFYTPRENLADLHAIGLDDRQLRLIERENALRLMPSLRERQASA